MKELLEAIVKAIVNNPLAVVVVEKESVDFTGLTILSIDVDDTDLGILIGKRGRTINAIRDIVTIAAIRASKRVKVIVNEKNRDSRDSRDSRDNTSYNNNNEQPIPVPVVAAPVAADVTDEELGL